MKRSALSLILLLLWFPSIPAYAADPPVTRGQFAVLLWQSEGGVPFDKTAHPFTDLPDDEEAQAVAWAYNAGLVQGVGGGLFSPGQSLSRQECATLLRRLDRYLGFDPFLPDGAALCNDYEGVDLWAGDDLYWACITGRMEWLDNRLAPLAPVSQAEAQALFF